MLIFKAVSLLPMHQIIFIHCGPFTDQTITLDGHIGLAGRDHAGLQACQQAIQIGWAEQGVPEILHQWLRVPSARLVYEIKAPKGWFLLVGVGSRKGPAFYLVNSDFDREIFWDEKGKVKSTKSLFQGLEKRKVTVEGPFDSLDEYQRLATGQHSNTRYAWLTHQPIAAWRKAQQRWMAAPISSGPGHLPWLLGWLPGDQPAIPLEPIHEKLLRFNQSHRAWQILEEQRDALKQWNESYQRYTATQEEATQLTRELAQRKNAFQGIVAQAAKDLDANQQQARMAESRRQQQIIFAQQEISQSLKRIGVLESTKASEKNTLKISDSDLADWPAFKQSWEAAWQHYQLLVTQRLQVLESSIFQPEEHSLDSILHAHGEQVVQHLLVEQKQAAMRDLESNRAREVKQQEEEGKIEEEAYQQEKSKLESRIQELQERIEGAGQTFMGWLQDRYPDWEENIGKVVREEVLFHPYLSPSVERLNDLLFGVNIDLSELDLPVSGVGHLQEQLAEQQKELEGLDASWQKQRRNRQNQQKNQEKRFKAHQSQLQRELQQAQYAREQATLLEKRLRNQRSEKRTLRQQRQQQRLVAIQHQITAAEQELSRLQQMMQGKARDFQELAQASLSPSDASSPELTAERERLHQWQSRLEELQGLATTQSPLTEDLAAQWSDHVEVLEQLDLPEIEQVTISHSPEDWLGQPTLLLELRQALQTHEDGLRAAANPMLAEFTPHNLFQLPTDQDQPDWLEIMGSKVPQLISEDINITLKEKISQGFGEVLLEIAECLPKLEKLQAAPISQRLTRLNQLLKESPFWDADFQLVLRKSPLFETLLAIQEMHQTQGYALQGASLFAQEIDPEIKEKALSVLNDLSLRLDLFLHDKVGISDIWYVEPIVAEDRPSPQALSQTAYHSPALGCWLDLAAASLIKSERGDSKIPMVLPHSGNLDEESLTELAEMAQKAGVDLILTGAQIDMVDELKRAYLLSKPGNSEAVLLMEKR